MAERQRFERQPGMPSVMTLAVAWAPQVRAAERGALRASEAPRGPWGSRNATRASMEGPEQKLWKIERLLRRGGAVYSVVPVKIRSRLLLLKAFKSQLSGAVTASAKPAVDVQAALGQGLGSYGREDLEGLFERMSCHKDVLHMILESI